MWFYCIPISNSLDLELKMCLSAKLMLFLNSQFTVAWKKSKFTKKAEKGNYKYQEFFVSL